VRLSVFLPDGTRYWLDTAQVPRRGDELEIRGAGVGRVDSVRWRLLLSEDDWEQVTLWLTDWKQDLGG
jgi:hypothetical protein